MAIRMSSVLRFVVQIPTWTPKKELSSMEKPFLVTNSPMLRPTQTFQRKILSEQVLLLHDWNFRSHAYLIIGGASYVEYGYCPRGPPFFDEMDVRRRLAHMNLHSFEKGHGHFFWNFRTEMEPRWDYLQVLIFVFWKSVVTDLFCIGGKRRLATFQLEWRSSCGGY